MYVNFLYVWQVRVQVKLDWQHRVTWFPPHQPLTEEWWRRRSLQVRVRPLLPARVPTGAIAGTAPFSPPFPRPRSVT